MSSTTSPSPGLRMQRAAAPLSKVDAAIAEPPYPTSLVLPPALQGPQFQERSSLNVIALVSGGKDSIYTILHCLAHGHKIIALANLSPPLLASSADPHPHDLNSHMYQTVGSALLPHLSAALRLPLFRRPITGTHRVSTLTYSETPGDEIEDLYALLVSVKEVMPEANAVCAGAIASSYQRVRVEDVARRLGLVPLAYLWMFPVVNGRGRKVGGGAGRWAGAETLLEDMAAVGLDARIVRVASAELGEGVLTRGLGESETKEELGRVLGSGVAVLGEGGEYETLVVDGPGYLFRERIVVRWPDKSLYVREGEGNVWVPVEETDVTTVSKSDPSFVDEPASVRIPDLLEEEFHATLVYLHDMTDGLESAIRQDTAPCNVSNDAVTLDPELWRRNAASNRWQILAKENHTEIDDEIKDIFKQLKSQLKELNLKKSQVVFVVILLDSMDNFLAINEVYKNFFDEPNPPARVTISGGPGFLLKRNILIQCTVAKGPQLGQQRRPPLHVQSRSYWAPANIGPYSQAHPIQLSNEDSIDAVYIAGQIGLDPATTELPSSFYTDQQYSRDGLPSWRRKFDLEAVLSLQHLWRIGREMDVKWWTGVVAYLFGPFEEQVSSFKAKLAGKAWEMHHRELEDEEDEDDDLDPWETMQFARKNPMASKSVPVIEKLPDRSVVEVEKGTRAANLGGSASYIPPFFAAEVAQLPKDGDIEWQALLGLTGGRVKIYYAADESHGALHQWSTPNSSALHLTLMLPFAPSRPSSMPEEAIAALQCLSSRSSFDFRGHLARAEGYYGAHAAWIDRSADRYWRATNYGGVIPCSRLFDRNGARLAAVLQFRVELGDGDD